ncbi:ATP-binding cassette, subfamily B [Acrasis kona]|uniref:ATP-binding cassette, subfamily B n=1 Tax=Acrasis kona TaxID=1008807 RepID=A0AAW2Z0W1_9EUKA
MNNIDMEDNQTSVRKLSTLKIASGLLSVVGWDIILIVLGILLTAANGVSFSIYFQLLGELLEGFTGSLTMDQLKSLTSNIGLKTTYIAIGSMIGVFFGKFLLGLSAQRVSCKINKLYFRRLMKQGIAYFDMNPSGTMFKTLSEDVAKLTSVLEYDLFNISLSLGQMLVGFIFSLVTAWQVGLLGFVSVPLMIVLLAFTSLIINFLTKRASNQTAGSVATANEVLGNMRTVRSMSGERKEISRFNRNVESSSTTAYISACVSAISSALIVFCLYGSISASFYYAGILLRDNKLGVAGLISMWGYVLISVQSLQMVLNYIPNVVKSHTSIVALLKVPDVHQVPGLTINDIKGHIVIDRVTFRYPSRPKLAVLNNFSLDIQPGKSVALVGQSGSGKSTIVGLIEKWYDYESGTITIDGVDLKSIDTNWLHRHVGIVSQEPTLFANTIAKNISYAVDTMNFNTRKHLETSTKLTSDEIESKLIIVTQEMIEEAARKANAHDFITKLPDGYNTVLGERGVSLSGGQKQRVAIARSVLQNPSILLLDEATSALDTKSESLVQEALDKLMSNRTTIVVAHRLTTVQNCDKIVVMKSGEVVEQGTHDELIDKPNGYYNALASKQKNHNGNNATSSSSDSESITNDQQDELTSSIDQLQDESTFAETTVHVEQQESQPSSIVDEQLNHQVKTFKKITNKGNKKKKKSQLQNIDQVKDIHEPKVKSFLPILPLLGSDLLLFPLFIVSALAVGTVPIMAIHIFGRIIKQISPQRNADGSMMPLPPGFNYYQIISNEALNLTYLTIAASIVQFAFHFFSNLSNERFGVKLKRAMFDNAIQQEMGYFDVVKTGKILSVFNEDVQNVKYGFSEKVANMHQYLAQFVIGIILAFISSWKITIVMLAASLGSTTIFTLFAQTAADYFNNRCAQHKKSSLVTATEVIGSMRTVRSMAGEALEIHRYETDLDKASRYQSFTNFIWGLFFGAVYFCVWGVNALGLYYGGILAADGEIASTALFVTTENMAIAVVGLSLCMMEIEHVFRAIGSSKNIIKVANRRSQIPLYSGEKIDIDGNVSLESVDFAYPSRPDVMVMKDFSLTIAKGQHVALVGESGSGKSTITGLIERFYDPIGGRVLIDGVNVKDLHSEWLHSHLSIVTQEPVLFATSIRKNITYAVDGGQDVPFERIQQVAKAANAHDFIMSLPDQYDTVVGERGVSMSGGQKQRIAIARAMLQDAAVLLLDEATSALDTEAESLVQDALDRLMVGKTTIVIAHRLNTVKNCDVIVVMEQGRMVEMGSHEELIARGGAYFELSQKQMEFGASSSGAHV